MHITVPASRVTPVKIAYTSDIHENKQFLAQFLDIAEQEAVDAVVIGGDICPKAANRGLGAKSILLKQRDYILFTFIPTLMQFKENNPKIKLFVDVGNDDFRVNRYFLQQHDGKVFKLLHMACHELTPDLNIAGYMCVPLTPFGIKDWEKADKKGVVDLRSITTGMKSINRTEIVNTTVNINSEDTIENDLKYLFSKMPKKRFVFVCHTPPYGTTLDMLYSYQHVGSTAVREFIEKRNDKIVVSLHGHIHESPEVSGKEIEKIGDVISINMGQTETTLRYTIVTIGT